MVAAVLWTLAVEDLGVSFACCALLFFHVIFVILLELCSYLVVCFVLSSSVAVSCGARGCS